MVDYSKQHDISKDVHKSIDALLDDSPEDLKHVIEHRKLIKKAELNPIPDDLANIKAFGKNVNINAILKKNELNRSIYTVDELCEMHLSMTIDKLLKYAKKKRGMAFEHWPIIILMIGISAAIMIIIAIFGG